MWITCYFLLICKKRDGGHNHGHLKDDKKVDMDHVWMDTVFEGPNIPSLLRNVMNMKTGNGAMMMNEGMAICVWKVMTYEGEICDVFLVKRNSCFPRFVGCF
jgi:hypothetical protein